MADESSGNSTFDPVLLSTFLIKRHRFRVYFHRGVLIWESEGAPYSKDSLPLSNVIAIDYEPVREYAAYTNELVVTGDVPDEHTSFTLHYVSRSHKHKLRTRKVTLSHADPRQIACWVKTIRNFINELTYRPKNILLFVNPFGGKGKGQKIYEKTVKPLLARAGVTTTVVITQHQNHAHETIIGNSLDEIDGIVCVGGDGTLSEIFNALILKTAREKGLDPDDPEANLPRPLIRVGVVPGGSTDTVAFCLHGTNDVQTAVLHIILGESVGLDICSVHTNSNLLRYYASMLSYGYLGDTCQLSESFRWMGPKRYDFSGFRNFLANRGYLSEITVLTESTSSAVEGPKCYKNCGTCRLDELGWKEKVSANWKTLKGKFFMVNGINMSCACSRAPNGFSPFCHIGNGCLDVVLIKHTNLFNNIRLLFRLSSKTRTVFDLPFVEVHRAREFIFQAMPDQKLALLDPDAPDAQTSVWNCDGEIVHGTSIRIRAHRQLIQMFSQRMEEDVAQSPSCFACK